MNIIDLKKGKGELYTTANNTRGKLLLREGGHWNGNIILRILSTVVAPELVILTSGVTNTWSNPHPTRAPKTFNWH